VRVLCHKIREYFENALRRISSINQGSMKYDLNVLLFLLTNSVLSIAQSWQPLLNGTDWPVQYLYADTLEGDLYVTGNFETAGGVEVNAVARWDGSSFYDLDGGMNYCINSCPVIFGVTKFQGNIICSPTGFSMGSNDIFPNGLVQWDGQFWKPIHPGLESFSGSSSIARKFINLNDTLLYVFGGFQTVGQDTAFSAATWNGQELVSLNFPFAPYGSAKIYDAIYHNNILYVGGNFQKKGEDENPTIDFAWYDGTWHAPDEGIKGQNDDIGAMVVFRDEIYVGGNFRVSSGNPANAIMKYRNGQFEAVGGSFDSELSNVRDLVVYDDKLFAFGSFNSVGGGVPANNMASWDGQKWCGYDFDFDETVGRAVAMNDMLFIGGIFDSIDNEPVNNLAYWQGAFVPAQCSTPVDVDAPNDAKAISLFPNPGHDLINLNLEHISLPASMVVYNAQGQEVHSAPIRRENNVLEVASWPRGIYVLTMYTEGALLTMKFVVE
jgi:hypothetical protein